jgi:inhibitor of cysteine peptidase
MRKIWYISIIGILLTLVAISPVIASPVAATTHSNYFSSITLLHPEQGRFVGSADFFKPVKSSSNNRFSSYISSNTGTIRTFTESDNGKTITVTKGQVVKVRLDENPTTGYRWEPSVSSGVQVTDDTYVASTSGRMGAGGVHTWTLQVTGTGNQHFDADYKRSWETGSEDSYSIQFVVA